MSDRLTKCKAPELLGMSAAIKFPESTAQVMYERDGMMRWVVTDKEGNITSGHELVAIVQITSSLYFLNYMEKTGFHVSQVIDLVKGEVMAFWSYQNGGKHRSSIFVKGSFELKKQH